MPPEWMIGMCFGQPFRVSEPTTSDNEASGLAQESDSEKRYHHGDLRAALIDAAVEMVDEEGLDGLSIRGLARRVGVTHSAPYRHFDGKDELIAAMAESGFTSLKTAMLEAISDGEDSRARFFNSGLSYVRFALDNRAMFRVMFCSQVDIGPTNPQVHRSHQEAYAVLVDLVEDCQRDGLIEPGPADAPATAAWALVHGLASLYVNGVFEAGDADAVVAMFQKCGGQLMEGMATAEN